jgi:hypothetical protein
MFIEARADWSIKQGNPSGLSFPGSPGPPCPAFFQSEGTLRHSRLAYHADPSTDGNRHNTRRHPGTPTTRPARKYPGKPSYPIQHKR